MKVRIRGLTQEEITTQLISIGEKPYRGKQVYHWLTARAAQDFAEMTDLPKGLRAKLSEYFNPELPRVINLQTASDGTVKFGLFLLDGEVIETVLIPERDHFTLCLSTQVGCTMGCRFCLTGSSGFKRNLEAWEIISQVVLAKGWLKERKEVLPLRNVVFMGMGEPLANYENLIKSLSILADHDGFNFCRKRLTVSTAGLVPRIYALAKDFPVALAVSLHTVQQELRDYLMPGVRKYPLPQLREAIRNYPRLKNGRTTVEFVLIKGLNDSLKEAHQLYQFLQGMKVKINLIPFNPHPELPFQRPEPEVVLSFQRYLLDRGLLTTIRKSKGLEISAACGQLRRRFLPPNTFQRVATKGAGTISL